MKAIAWLFFLGVAWELGAQNNQVMQLRPLCADEPIDTVRGNQLADLGEVFISKFKFYLSVAAEGQSTSPEKVHLFDFRERPWIVQLDAQSKLYLGVDSLLNAQGIHEGDLDPIQGMYWSWQTGYIHLKVEGWFKTPAGRREEFVFHIGGFNHPSAGPYFINLDQEGEMEFDLAPVLKWAFEKDIYRIMSPGPKADRFARYFVNSIKVK